MRLILCAFALTFCHCMAMAQNSNFKRAIEYMANSQYELALIQLQNDLPSIHSSTLLATAQCHFYLNNLDESDKYIDLSLKTKNINSQSYFWKARLSHHRLQFEKAIDYYKIYLKNQKDDQNSRDEVKHLIRQCGHAIKWQYKEQLGYVENLGSAINTKYDEFAPVFSPIYQERIYFSSNRVLSGWEERLKVASSSSNIYGIDYIDDTWSEIFVMNETLNKEDHNILQDIDPTGQRVMVFQVLQGNILVDTFSEDKPRRGEFSHFIKPSNGDQYVNIINDSIVLFAGNRKDTYGGLDIYAMIKKDGYWEEPINLGPKINSPFEEISPFLSADGKSLYLSSNRPSSIGGFDVFVSEYNEIENEWSNSSNAYTPVNSAGDDINFRLNPTGTSAIFSSDRKDGKGGFDLFMLYFKNPVPEKMVYTESLYYFENLGTFKNEIESENDAPPKKEVRIPYLMYGEDDFIMTPINLKKLKDLKYLLITNKDISVDILGHTDDSQNPDFDLFFSIKRAEKIKGYLIKEGVKADRIFTLGAGKSFPIAKNSINGVPNPSGQKFNRRIDFKLHNIPDRFEINYDHPTIVSQFQETLLDQFNRLRMGLTYKVFVMNSNLPRIPENIKNHPFLLVEKYDEISTYDYTVGLVDNYFDANLLKQQLRSEGLEEATIHAYIDGRRLLDREINNYTAAYPDLVFFQYRSED